MLASLLEAGDGIGDYSPIEQTALTASETGLLLDDLQTTPSWGDDLFRGPKRQLFTRSYHDTEGRQLSFGARQIFDGYVVYVSQTF